MVYNLTFTLGKRWSLDVKLTHSLLAESFGTNEIISQQVTFGVVISYLKLAQVFSLSDDLKLLLQDSLVSFEIIIEVREYWLLALLLISSL